MKASVLRSLEIQKSISAGMGPMLMRVFPGLITLFLSIPPSFETQQKNW